MSGQVRLSTGGSSTALRLGALASGVGLAIGLAASSPAADAAASPTIAFSHHATQVTYRGTPEKKNPTVEPRNKRLHVNSVPIVLQSSMIGRESGEPTVGVDKKGTVYFPGDTFDTPGGVLARNLEMRSTDGGRTWTDVSPTAANGGHGADSHPATLDTITYVDKDYGRVFTVDTLAAEGSVLSFSDDHGKTWTTTMALAGGVNDHETIVTGVVPKGSGLPTLDKKFPKIVYYCVNTVAAVSCSRSLDGGVTFTQMNSPFPTHPTQKLPLSALCSSLTGHLAVDKQGDLFVPSAFNEIAGCGTPAVAVSTDGGTTWKDYPVAPQIKDPFNAMSVAAAPQGHLYATWQDDKHNLPYLAVSRNHGKTWSTPVMIAPPGVRTTNFPTLDVGSTGRVVITFPGSTDAKANTEARHAPWAYYVVFTQNGLAKAPTFTSQVAQIPARLGGGTTMHRGACNGRCGGLFDFLDVRSAPMPGGAAYATLSDDCTGACATQRTGKSNDSSAGQGLLVREIAGPALTGVAKALPGSRAVAAAAASTSGGAGSGLSGLVPVSAVALLGCAVGMLRQRRRFGLAAATA